jgi:RNA polymerase sigma-70 factor (ECF subfamily)
VDTRSDAELVTAAQEHPDAFGELVRRHQSFVFGAALRVTRDGVLAEEVAQETFFRAYRSLQNFRGDSKLRTWLYRIATNLAIDLVARRRERPMEELPEQVSHRTPATDVEIKMQSAELREALGQLPEALREPLVLREYELLSYDEIGRRLDIPLNTVRTRIFRAKAQLRDMLKDWDDD